MFAIATTHRARRVAYRAVIRNGARGKRAYGVCGPFRAFRREIFHPDSPNESERPARVRALFTRPRVTLRLPAEKVSADESRRLHGRVCTGASSRPFPSSIRPCSSRHHGGHTHVCERERARASRDRGGKFHSRIHSLANRFPA